MIKAAIIAIFGVIFSSWAIFTVAAEIAGVNVNAIPDELTSVFLIIASLKAGRWMRWRIGLSHWR